MPPGSEEVVKQAASHGWEALLLAVLVLSMLSALWFVWKSTTSRLSQLDEAATKREDRLVNRVTALENLIETKLLEIVQESTVALSANTNALVRTNEVLDEMKRCVTESHKDTQRLLQRIEASPCFLSTMGMLSEETRRNVAKMAAGNQTE